MIQFLQSRMIYTVDVAPAPCVPWRFFYRMAAAALMGLSDDDWGGSYQSIQVRAFPAGKRFSIPKDVFGEVVDTVFFLVRCVMIDELHEIFKRFFCPAVFFYAHPPLVLAGMVHKS